MVFAAVQQIDRRLLVGVVAHRVGAGCVLVQAHHCVHCAGFQLHKDVGFVFGALQPSDFFGGKARLLHQRAKRRRFGIAARGLAGVGYQVPVDAVVVYRAGGYAVSDV